MINKISCFKALKKEDKLFIIVYYICSFIFLFYGEYGIYLCAVFVIIPNSINISFKNKMIIFIVLSLWGISIFVPNISDSMDSKYKFIEDNKYEFMNKESINKSDTNDESTVYITPTGTKYHKKDCTFIKNTSFPIDIDIAKEQGYEACKKCCP